MYEVICEGISRKFYEGERERAFDLVKTQSCEYGVAVLRDWDEGYKFVYANGSQVDCEPMLGIDDDEVNPDDEDWDDEEDFEDWDDYDGCDPYEDFYGDQDDEYDDYDEPYDLFDEVGYDPYSGGYDPDL